jgi:hypothetical protein
MVPRATFGCSLCGHTFGTLALFDAHQQRPQGWAGPVQCTAPEAMGLVPDDTGTWQTPEGLQRHAADRARLAERVRAGLRESADSVEPTGTLAELRARIAAARDGRGTWPLLLATRGAAP